ncbi:MAG: NAD-dependent epimerase/dehydratase family protein [Proteobacteria bacterium]|nr:NAD-dependent epimerase/dehydratase family protein [Pseudomonadota bacterium]
MSQNKILIAGGTGLVGSAVVRHFEQIPDWEVVAVSRRRPAGLRRATHVSVDLEDAAHCAEVFGAMTDVTHVCYAALYEVAGQLIQGWRARDQMQTNLAMLRNLFDPLERAATGLQHITFLQGTKAYGIHLEPLRAPAREQWPRHDHENFYWLHQDYIAEKQRGKRWTWTILRPQLTVGQAIKGNLNVLAALGVFAAVEREAGKPLSYPGGPPLLCEAVDADLLARAMEWAATTPACGNEVYNIANGDVMAIAYVWPTLAECFGMHVGRPKPLSLAEELPRRQREWAACVAKYDLVAPQSIPEFIGESAEFTDFTMATGFSESPPPILVSTIKARLHGFHDCIDTEDMFRKWIRRYQEARLLPPL